MTNTQQHDKPNMTTDEKCQRFANPHFGTFAFFQRDNQIQKMQKSQNFPAAHPCGNNHSSVQNLELTRRLTLNAPILKKDKNKKEKAVGFAHCLGLV